ncbi:SNF2 helicase-associated domain-containing protein [Streptomyces sp. NPDC006602]|uniref:SNF2 helicase-associated domain-containing protein n=1 Tax=Streptomyces sp. NPDC006602 TaxID=3364751 RepID=UPI003680F55A
MGALPYAWRDARAVPTLRERAEETQAALTAEVSVSLRVDVPEGRRRQFRAVLQLHTAADPALVVEAARLWSEPTEVERLLGPRAETETLLALRRGARAWPPLRRLLDDAAPDQLRLTDDEAFDLFGDATDALRVAGVDVHWPRELVTALTATAEIGQRTAPGSTAGGLHVDRAAHEKVSNSLDMIVPLCSQDAAIHSLSGDKPPQAMSWTLCSTRSDACRAMAR